jgi:hypothetical protein
MVGAINDRLIFGNMVSARCFYPKESHWKKYQTPDLIYQGHNGLNTRNPDAKGKKWEKEKEPEQPPKGRPNDIKPPDKF